MSKIPDNTHLQFLLKEGKITDLNNTVSAMPETAAAVEWLEEFARLEKAGKNRASFINAVSVPAAQMRRVVEARDGVGFDEEWETPSPKRTPLDDLAEDERHTASWLIHAGADDTHSTIARMTGTEGDLRALRAAHATESARPDARSSRLKPIEAAIKRFEKTAAKDGEAHVVTDPAAMDLDAIKQALEAEHATIIKHEDAFKDATLPRFLRIGLCCLKAHAIFALAPDAREGVGGRGKKNSVHVDGVSEPQSFEGWLQENASWLPKANAYRYKRAVQGLGLEPASTEEELDIALEGQIALAAEKGEKLSINKLANLAGPPALPAPPAGDPNTPEAKAGEARVFATEWVKRWDLGVKAGNLEDLDLDGLKQLDEFLSNTREHVRKRINSAKEESKDAA